MAKEEVKEKEVKKEKYMVGEVATQTQPVIVNTETDETYTVEIALAKVLNELEVIKKLL